VVVWIPSYGCFFYVLIFVEWQVTEYPEGQVVTVQGTFKNTLLALADPSVVKLTIKSPTEPETTYEYLVGAVISKVSTGIYTADLDTTGKRGLWIYTWWSTGTGQSDSGEQEFEVV
jgi:hypothetical protein